MSGSYNKTFERLVTGKDDLVGLLAYSLYKQSKSDWIKRFKQRTPDGPTQPELDAYADHLGDDDLNRLRGEAQSMLFSFADTFLQERMPSIRENFIKTELSPLLANLQKTVKDRTSFISALLANIAATLVIGGVTAIVILTLILPDLGGSLLDWALGQSPKSDG